MGFFSDMLKMAASEVVNAVVDGINETAAAEEEKELRLAEFKKTYAGVSYATLVSQSEYEGYDADEVAMLKTIIEERKQFAELLCTSPAEVLQDFDDEDLVTYYSRLLETKASAVPEEYAKKVVRVFRDEVMSRKVAKRIYAQQQEDCFSETRYDELITIIEGNNVFYDEVLKRVAERELRDRNCIIEALSTDAIDDLENDEFMEMYALVRADKTEKEVNTTGTYNRYFGKSRKQILTNCEREIFTNRKFLVKRFLSEYCEEEFENYLNYSNKKLSTIISLADEETTDVAYEYDLCDKLIAEAILAERGCE